MNVKINTRFQVAVDQENEWLPMSSCPIAAKVQLLGQGRVATYGAWDGKNQFWIGWHPIPKIPNWME